MANFMMDYAGLRETGDIPLTLHNTVLWRPRIASTKQSIYVTFSTTTCVSRLWGAQKGPCVPGLNRTCPASEGFLSVLHSLPNQQAALGVGNRLDGDRARRADLSWTKGCRVWHDAMPSNNTVLGFVPQMSITQWLAVHCSPSGGWWVTACASLASFPPCFTLTVLFSTPKFSHFCPLFSLPVPVGVEGGEQAPGWVLSCRMGSTHHNTEHLI